MFSNPLFQTSWLVVFSFHLMTGDVHSLSIQRAASTGPLPDRRDFMTRVGAGVASSFSNPFPVLADGGNDDSNNESIVASLLNAKTILWNGPSWSSCRYGTSTLLSSNNNQSNNAPPPGKPAYYPEWLEGYHAINYKFSGASFPQGRNILSLRTAGAGLGTCLSLPNVGYSPPAAHALHFIKGGDGNNNGDCCMYEDLMYNVPRKFEAFWPDAKVVGVQTNGGIKEDGSNNILSPKCLVTGDGCSSDINPNLHSPASRVAIDFDGPTRRGGRLTQSSDATMLDHSIQINGDTKDKCYVMKSYSQYNLNQDLQTFYKEITSLRRVDDGNIVGKMRVAAFLPRYIKDMDATGGGEDYDEKEAVAIYDYKMIMKSIDDIEAASI